MSRTVKQKNKAIAKSCTNNGGCPVCERRRLYNTNKKLEATSYSMNTIDK